MAKMRYILLFFALTIDSFSISALNDDWWTHSVIYQVFTRSFKDSDGDGIGDLKGLINKLDHFADSKIDAIFLAPIYESPMVDEGYDVKNYRKISSDYGTMKDFEDLIAKAKKLKVKIVLELMANHCSNESDYFQKSVNREDDYDDFFVWADGNPDPDTDEMKPPNNWVSIYSGSAWAWHEEREQYYLTRYSKAQADFNYRHPGVFKEIKDIMTFYLNKGVDGFYINASPFLVEAMNSDGTYPDDPVSGANGTVVDRIYSQDQNETFDFIYRWRSFLDDYKDENGGNTRVLLAGSAKNISFTVRYFGNETNNGSQIPLKLDLTKFVINSSSARDIVFIAQAWLTYVQNKQYPNWVLGNFHSSRLATRLGMNKADGMIMMQMLLPGIALTYQGDELGMSNGKVSYEETHDIWAFMAGMKFSRDPARTPYHWDDSKNAGFSDGSKTWLPVAENYKTINLMKEKNSTKSHYKVYQESVRLRNKTVVKYGAYDLKPVTDDVFALTRSKTNYYTYGMVMNVGDHTTKVNMTQMRGLGPELEVVVSSVNSKKNKGDKIKTENVRLLKEESFLYRAKPNRASGRVQN